MELELIRLSKLLFIKKSTRHKIVYNAR